MLDKEILLTTPTYPYPTLPANDSITDATGQRFTKGDDIFTIFSHTHCYANHILAQNVDVPARLLEYPRWDDFTKEVDKGYGVIGISSYPPHLDRVMDMCRYVRRRSPATKILLGSYAAQAFAAKYDAAKQKEYVDHVVLGEGVQFLRSFLGERVDRPVTQALMPKGGGALPYMSKFPKGNIAFLVSGLGCIGGCDFCSTTALFDQKRIELLSPDELVHHIQLYADNFPEVSQVFVIEEDHFRHPSYLQKIGQYWESRPDVVESLDWFGFGSIDNIGKFAERYGWDRIAELGIGSIFIGVESKFAGGHGIKKRENTDARVVFQELHRRGIRTVGAWMCGWDWHNHGNIHEDLNYFVSLYPTYQQLTRVSPFPGTPLWDQMREAGRTVDVPWEDVHFWSGSQKNTALEIHETLNFTEYGYDLLYKTWGPSVLRRLDVQLSGYEHCMRSKNPIMRRHKALFHKRQCATAWTNLPAMDRFAPNGVVRRRARKIDERYRRLIGEPTPVMRALASAAEVMAAAYKVKEFYDPLNRHPKEEPFKRYLYNRGSSDGVRPYDIDMPRPTAKVRAQMKQADMQATLLARMMRTVQLSRRSLGDPAIDDHMIRRSRKGWLGLGF